MDQAFPAEPQALTQKVSHFRHLLLWPLQLEAAWGDEVGRKPWRTFDDPRWVHPWHRVADEFSVSPREFYERHYKEFLAFLPFVQRFLFGDARCAEDGPNAPLSAAPMRVFGRDDVKALKITLAPGDEPIRLVVDHVQLYFFLELDIVLLNVEVQADDLPLETVQDLLYRFGRAYPTGWDDAGQGLHNVYRSEWLGEGDVVLSRSDSGDRERYLGHVCRNRAPCLGAHWAWLLQPMVSEHSPEDGPLRYRQVEYHRMPFMAYLALENPRALSREDFIHLGLISYLRPGDPLSPNEPSVVEFERRYCDDRYWSDSDQGPNTRFLCSGHSLIAIGEAGSAFFRDDERGLLAQFRHQYFLLFLIAHFHRVALLTFSDRLAAAISGLDIRKLASVRRFKQRIRSVFSLFLGFSHRYWFHQISERGQVQSLFARSAKHLGNEELFEEVKQQINDMNNYLDSDSARRQSSTVMRLTVVTIFGLIGTISTGFLGMNLIAEAEAPFAERIAVFIVTTALSAAVTLFAVVKSKRLSDFIEQLADESLSPRQKGAAFLSALRRSSDD
ncbi:CorA family divalent cation transporter [Niveibacterium terrae]|uniref:CorA family divalent cation transporter n=1 Tax=Niveibacterium terrae TaxID=3373598 RepID=UPI003A93F0F4